MTTPTSFGRWLKERRKTLDLTQEALARQVGCAVITIKKLEADSLRPSRQIAERMADALEIAPDDRATFVRLARATPRVDGPPIAPQTPSLLPQNHGDVDLSGQVVKGYELRERIGVGGFGAVYRAAQPNIAREVAVKIILPQYANHPEFIRRFEAEAQIVARLEHPHIVPLYDYWREPGGAYLVMRYVSGGSLQTALQGTPWPIDRVTRLLEQVGAALQFAHRQGVVHRDIKPANILLTPDDNAYLADFGIAKELGAVQPTDQTQPDVVVGSPAYLSPEQIKDEPITPQTDVYSLGIVLYELLTRTHPFAGLSPAERLARQLNEPLPPLRRSRSDLPDALDMIIQRATAKRPGDRYSDVVDLVRAWQQAVGAGDGLGALSVGAKQTTLTQATSNGRSAVEDRATETDLNRIENPYKGLRAFGEADAADFFGRATLTERLLERMAEETAGARFLAVVGPSGSGKSSVVRAGLVPAIRRGGLPSSERWFVVEMVPGAHPLEELEAALLRVAVNPPASLLEQLLADERGLARAVKRILPPDEAADLVLVIDQFEELFTLVEDEAARAHMLNNLVAAITDPRSRLRVVVTLRADFYDRPLQYADFAELVRRRTEVVLPLAPEELREAVDGPAARVGLHLEPTLVAAILKDVGEQPGTLPLLQYALTELFERRAGRTLTLAAYQASGGVQGALARRADELYDGLDTQGQEAARQLFLRLITLGEGVEDTRRRVRRAELAGDSRAMEAAIELYGRYRLLTFDRDPITRQPTVEVAHEALIRTWGRLRDWLEASREGLRVQRRLAAAATEWINSGRDSSFLASGARLAQFAAFAEDGNLALNDEERAHLRASIVERERQEVAEHERQARELVLQKRAANRLRYLVGALSLFLVVAIGLSAFAFNRQAVADANAAKAETNAVEANVQRQRAEANFTRSEAQRLATEANALLQMRGNAETIALLSIRSLNTQYSSQGDAALQEAATLDYAQQVFIGHTEALWGVAFSPDGRYLLTGGNDKVARLWDVQTGKELRSFVGHTHWMNGLAFSPDGKYILTSSDDMTARLWDVQTGAELRVFSGHTDVVFDVAFSPDSKYIVTGSLDKTARLWDTQSGQELRQFSSHTDLVWGVAFSPDGRTILTGNSDRTARLWDTQTGQEIRRFVGHTELVGSVAFSPDGNQILTGSYDKTARLWDAKTGRELRQFVGHSEYIKDVAFAPNGKYVLTGSDDKTARLWDAETGVEVRRFVGHTSFVFGVAFSLDGNYIATSSLDKTARLWRTQPRPELPQFIGHTNGVRTVAFSPDGKYVLTGSDDQTAQLWDAQTGTPQRTFSGHTSSVSGVFSPDGKYILTGSQDQSVRLWDAQTGAELRRFVGHTSFVNSVAFSPDGRSVLSGSNDNTARLWDAQTGTQLQIFTGHEYQIFDVAYSPDGKYILTGAYDKTARLWDAQTGRQLHVFDFPNDGAASVTFSPDGKFVLTGSWDGMVRLWDAQTGVELRQFAGHNDVVWEVVFSADGKLILTASKDNTARLWDLQTGAEVRRFTGHTAAIQGVAFSPDGRYALTGSSDGTARLWDVDYHDTIRDLCNRLLRDFSDDERAQYGISDTEPTCPKS